MSRWKGPTGVRLGRKDQQKDWRGAHLWEVMAGVPKHIRVCIGGRWIEMAQGSSPTLAGCSWSGLELPKQLQWYLTCPNFLWPAGSTPLFILRAPPYLSPLKSWPFFSFSEKAFKYFLPAALWVTGHPASREIQSTEWWEASGWPFSLTLTQRPLCSCPVSLYASYSLPKITLCV